MNIIKKKRQFIKGIVSGKGKIEDYNLETFEAKKLSLDMLSNEDLQWLANLYSKYDPQGKNDILSTSVLSPEELIKFKEIEKRFIYN